MVRSARRDVESHWARPYVAEMIDRGIVTGYEDGPSSRVSFPKRDRERGERTVFLVSWPDQKVYKEVHGVRRLVQVIGGRAGFAPRKGLRPRLCRTSLLEGKTRKQGGLYGGHTTCAPLPGV
ncbi:MAG TPA: S-layer homology domain-containing protein [Clostridia bacterium]|nr:S-layer homology domain-containing protein [Clostridia bacterium]